MRYYIGINGKGVAAQADSPEEAIEKLRDNEKFLASLDMISGNCKEMLKEGKLTNYLVENRYIITVTEIIERIRVAELEFEKRLKNDNSFHSS